MKRRDYKQLMQQKKRNKNYAKMAILGALGLGIGLANSDIVNAEEWVANTTTSIQKGDTQYTIKWGDYLDLISKDSGLTIDTLMKLNDNIVDANLIYAGNIILFGDGTNVVAKDNSGNVIASTELTEADKEGIKEAQSSNNTNTQSSTTSKQDSTSTNTNITSNNSNASNTSNNNVTNTSTNNNSNDNTSTNTNKPSTPNNSGNTGSGNGQGNADNNSNGNTGTGKPELPNKPTDPSNPTDPIDPVADTMLATRMYFDVDTEEYVFTDALEVTLKDGKAVVKADTIPKGYRLIDGESDTREVSKAQSTALFSVEKIEDTEKPVEPTHTEETVVVNVDTDGNVLSSTNGYTYVSESTDNGVTTTAENGDTHTVFTKTVVWAKDYVPVHEDKYVTVNVDTNGNVLSSTDGYDYVSESTDNGVTTTSENGDTVTTYTTTVVWSKKEVAPENPYMGQSAEVIRGEYNGTFYEGMGNSGMVWDDQMTASMWAITELANNHGGDGSYLTWQVRVKGSNAIKWTVQLLPN